MERNGEENKKMEEESTSHTSAGDLESELLWKKWEKKLKSKGILV